MNFSDFVIVVPCVAALTVGYILKHLIPSDKVNRFIPLVAAAVGLCMNAWCNMSLSPEIVVGGVVSGLASTGMHQLFKQFVGDSTNSSDDTDEK